MSSQSDIDDCVTSAANRQGIQKILTIPGRIVLDEMLRQLGFPMAQYQRKVYEDGRISVSVIFQTASLSSQGPGVPITISGIRSLDGALAEHTAAIATITYMQSATNTIIRDLNYNRLKEKEEENSRLRSQLADAKSRLRKASLKIKKLARGWFFSVRTMFSFSAQFQNVAIISSFGAEQTVHDNMKPCFANIHEIARRLESKSTHLENKLEEIRSS